ncbi:hypothetical protein ACQ4M4_12815 [Leptolyngbya sp. AN02str]|uniref:hypothetical protein n=1 Tax=Leptolyngbya sp. AN02str TaxID=3423363 RepID=UPI003D313682
MQTETTEALVLCRRHWVQLDLASPSMELADFQQHYSLSREQLARVAHCSLDTVNRWFMKPTNSRHRSPTPEHKLRFAIAHYVWSGEWLGTKGNTKN